MYTNKYFLIHLKVFVSYLNNEIRNCCLLLSASQSNPLFSSSEIKIIRGIIADLKAAPKLTDSPINFEYDLNEGKIIIYHSSFKIICQIISSLNKPKIEQVNRIKILSIINENLNIDSKVRSFK